MWMSLPMLIQQTSPIFTTTRSNNIVITRVLKPPASSSVIIILLILPAVKCVIWILTYTKTPHPCPSAVTKQLTVLIFIHRLNIHLNRNKHSKTLPWKCAWNILHKLISQLRRFLCCVWQRWLSLHLLSFRNYKWTILQVVHLTPNWSHENSFNYSYCFRSTKHCSVDYLTFTESLLL